MNKSVEKEIVRISLSLQLGVIIAVKKGEHNWPTRYSGSGPLLICVRLDLPDFLWGFLI